MLVGIQGSGQLSGELPDGKRFRAVAEHVCLNPSVRDDGFLDQCRLLHSEVVAPLREAS